MNQRESASRCGRIAVELVLERSSCRMVYGVGSDCIRIGPEAEHPVYKVVLFGKKGCIIW